jgi:hypothetical protein
MWHVGVERFTPVPEQSAIPVDNRCSLTNAGGGAEWFRSELAAASSSGEIGT